MESASTYNFFLSYANEEPNELVERFFKDLCGEVCRRAGIRHTEDIGFLDQNSIRLGTEWAAELVEALNRCQVFIALCSPLYFVSQACGQEWWLFEQRLDLYKQSDGSNPPLLLPIWWLPTDQPHVPERVKRRQFAEAALGPEYKRDGLRQLLVLRDQQDNYRRVVSALAQRIVEIAHKQTLPRLAEDYVYAAMPNAFTDRAIDARGGPGGGRHVHFVVGAPRLDELYGHGIRRNLWYYGTNCLDWAPYLQHADDTSVGPIARSARAIAATDRYHSTVTGMEELAGRLELARRNNQLVVALVDPWSAGLPEHERAFTELDEWADDTSPMLIPSGVEDAETQEHWKELADRLRTVFRRRYGYLDAPMLRDSVLSQASFDADLRVALAIAQNRMHRRGTPLRDLPAGDSAPVPPRLGIPLGLQAF